MTAVAQYGGLDIVVHNAGGPPAGEFFSMSEAQWQKAFEQNLLSFVRIVHAAVPEMKKSGGGRILTIASSSIKQPIPEPGAVECAACRHLGHGEDAVARARAAQDPGQRDRARPHSDRAHRRDRSGDRRAVGRGARRGAQARPRRAFRSAASAAPTSSRICRVPGVRRGELHHRSGDQVDGGAALRLAATL